MAKWKKDYFGSVLEKKKEYCKFNGDENGNDTPNKPLVKEFTIKFKKDCSFKAGDTLNLENKALRLATLNLYKGSMSEENYEKALADINNIKDFVKFELIKLSKIED